MYKTIRHGENSLQYTILPQNDDFRLEGKIKAGSGGGGVKKSKAKKPKRRSFFAYLGLLFVCTVIIGAVLVPFLVSAECLPNPTEWFLKTKNAFSQKPLELKDNVPTHLSTQNNILLNKGNLALNVGKPVKIINKDGVEKFILKVNKSVSTEAPKLIHDNKPIANVNNTNKDLPSPTTALNPAASAPELNEKISISHLNLNADTTSLPSPTEKTPDVSLLKTLITQTTLSPATTTTAAAAPTTTITPTLSPLLNRPLSSASVPSVPRASLQSALNQNSNSSSTQPTITTRIMQVPLLKSTAKKPAIPPVLVKNLSPIQPTPDNSNLNDILPAKTAGSVIGVKEGENSDWIHSHWPYIDPSTYFQWNGYKTEDSVLLPALLGFALIGVILIITVCLVARNKRTIVTSVRKRNRNDLEETGAEDNTTLLTNTNLSDED
ncbi:uncharacterized protein LOC119603615 [Lucilia sericata]|uniref:uncharacterized protein LOC119603615 n=1 Tax=Lucilia sericata TaxID=13632 RepID=UPI0018A7F2B6|nr:uncharacterized protein LOC119603615 [Lucilia sericata]XP_037811642.1 uncharacterized protein LOC119603615 [Lucilia sericata]